MWLLPTLDRVDKLKEFLMAAAQTEMSTPLRILVDAADWEKNQAAYLEIEKTFSETPFIVTKAVTMGDKIREAWVHVKDSKWVGVLNDDHYPVTKNWDVKLRDRLDGKNFVSSNDRWMAPMKAATATAWSMPLLEALGWPIYPPGLQHLFIDDIFEAIGRGAGCWRICMDVVVEHRHVLNGRGAKDETHDKVYSQKAWDRDHATFELFMKHDFQEVIKKVQALQGDIPMQRWNPAPSNTEVTNVNQTT